MSYPKNPFDREQVDGRARYVATGTVQKIKLFPGAVEIKFDGKTMNFDPNSGRALQHPIHKIFYNEATTSDVRHLELQFGSQFLAIGYLNDRGDAIVAERMILVNYDGDNDKILRQTDDPSPVFYVKGVVKAVVHAVAPGTQGVIPGLVFDLAQSNIDMDPAYMFTTVMAGPTITCWYTSRHARPAARDSHVSLICKLTPDLNKIVIISVNDLSAPSESDMPEHEPSLSGYAGTEPIEPMPPTCYVPVAPQPAPPVPPPPFYPFPPVPPAPPRPPRVFPQPEPLGPDGPDLYPEYPEAE